MTSHLRLAFTAALTLAAAASSSSPGITARQPQVPTRAAGQTATTLPDGTVLLTGGEGADPTLLVYDPRTRITRVAGRLHTARRWHTATVLADGRVLVAGGLGPDGQIVPDAERFDPATGAVTAVADLTFTPRAHHTATLLTTGQILFAGGQTPGGGGPRAEVWDSDSNVSAVVAGPPGADRFDGEAELRSDGRVRIAGGRGGDRAEIFDPELLSFVGEERLPPDTAESAAEGVAGILPADGASDVATGARVAIRFGTPVDPRSVVAGLAASDGAAVPAFVVTAESGRLVFLTPSAPLAADTVFHVTLHARTARGRAVAPFASTFRTARPADAAASSTDHDDPEAGGGLDSSWRKLPPLEAPPGVTALAGQVLRLNGQPLAEVTLELGDRRVRTDRTGRFLLGLGADTSGWREMVIDGRTASRGRRTYGVFEVAVQIVEGKTAPLPYTIWMPALDTKHAVRIASPTRRETVITTPHIPGLELHLPPNTVITDHEGRVVREISITPIPVDRPPFPLPSGVQVPVYFTIQPGGAYVAVKGYGSGRKGAWLVYPNYLRKPAGARHQFWHYDPEEKGWHVYGMGQVEPSGRQVVPNPDVALYEFTGAMINGNQTPPGQPGGFGPSAGDPVDLATGQFVMDKTDLVVPDVIPLVMTRTYRTGDNASRAFGIGAMHPYGMFLYSANQYQEADLILPDGKRIHYVRTSTGTGFADAEFEHTSTPTRFYKSTIVWRDEGGWNLTLRDGTVYVFGDATPLQAIRDRFGNTVTLTWSDYLYGDGYGRILKVTSPNGRWLSFDYDTSDRIIEVRDNFDRTVEYEYDAAGRVWKVTDARGGVTEYTYDVAHRMLTIKDPRNIVYLENDYDVNGRIELQTQADGGEYAFDYTVNGSGQVTQTEVTNPRGFVRRVTFNADGFTTADTHALGEPIEQTTTYTRQTGSNLLETETDELGRVTRYTYDGLGNVATVTRLDGTADAVTTTYTHDPTYSLLTSMTDPLSHTTTIGYGSQGRLASLTDALSHQTTFGTNAAGQVIAVTDPLSKVTGLTYARGELASVETPLGHTTMRFVDAVGRLVGVADALGARSRFEYNAHNQITKIIDPLGGETTFTYDGNGNLLTLTDPRSKTTTWTYDSMDRVATRTDPLSRSESFEYDLNGNLIEWTDRKGQVTTYQYDALDRQTFVGFGTTAGPTYASTIATTFDAGDRAVEIDDSVAGTIERTYDLLDRLTEETTPEGTITYTYDDASRRATMQVAGQTQVSYTYDNADRLTGVTQGSASVTIAYDNADRRTSLTLPNGIVAEYTYDDDSRLTSITYKGGGTPIGDLTYSYDAAGRRTSVGGMWARTNLPAALASATYDDANQIATFGGVSFTYDANGNLTSDGVRSYTWDARDQLASLTGPVSGSFAYDAVGRRRSKTISGTTTSFLYDGLNPVQELSSGVPVANLLTGLGIDEYFARTDGARVREFLTDALGSSVALADGAATIQTEYTYEPFGGMTTDGASTSNGFGFTGREADGTGLFFYRARYYDPRLQRFTCEDPLEFSAGDANLYAYVSNDPVRYADPLGLGKVGGTIRIVRRIGDSVRRGRSASMKEAQNARRRGADVLAPDRRTAERIHDGAFGKDPTAGETLHHGPHQPGYYPHYQANKKKGHTFYLPALVPGADLGDIAGRKSGIPLLGDLVDWFNPLSDIQDVIDVVNWLAGS